MGVTNRTPSLGVGQSWQDVTLSRVLGTNYTNDTGKPIQVYAYIAGTSAAFFVNGTAYFPIYNGTSPSIATVVVPVGATYRAAGTTLTYWWELR